jgi:hypothetical protein
MNILYTTEAKVEGGPAGHGPCGGLVPPVPADLAWWSPSTYTRHLSRVDAGDLMRRAHALCP